MPSVKNKRISRQQTVKGSGLVGTVLNKAIDALPIELHLPGGYRYCGPGTRLKERLARGDPGINELDEACKTHDIAYSLYKDNFHRGLADNQLAESAWNRVKSSNASLGEKAAAWAVTTAMKTKSKLGGGVRKRKGKGIYLKPKSGSGTKKGGILPVVPILAGLSALGSLIGGVSTAIRNAKGKGLRLAPYKGTGLKRTDKKKKKRSNNNKKKRQFR